MLHRKIPSGFTIVELLIAIIVMSILAGISVVGYGAWRERVAKTEVTSDLSNAAKVMKDELNFKNAYPTTIPDYYKPSPHVVIEMIQAPEGKYCINAYHKEISSISNSISSDQLGEIRNVLCAGPASGSPIGGSVPAATKGTNIMPGFDQWTLTGTATYNSSTKELVLGTNGLATSPKVRVNGAAFASIDGLFYATAQTAYASYQPNGGWHSGSAYFATDGTTLVTNTGNYTGNGCAKKVTLGSYNTSQNGPCSYLLGPNVYYLRIQLYSSANGFASSDLKIKDFSAILQ